MAKRENLTIRQLYLRAVLRGHNVVCGTPQRIADHIEEWFLAGAADGFNIMPPYLPGAFDDFVELSSPSCSGAACSGPNTKAGHSEITWA